MCLFLLRILSTDLPVDNVDDTNSFARVWAQQQFKNSENAMPKGDENVTEIEGPVFP